MMSRMIFGCPWSWDRHDECVYACMHRERAMRTPSMAPSVCAARGTRERERARARGMSVASVPRLARGGSMMARGPDDRDEADALFAPAENLLRLLEERKRRSPRAAVGGLTWEIGQKRPVKGDAFERGAGDAWVLVEKHATKHDARAAVRRRPNGVTFKYSRNSSTHWYYTCATHAANGCPCVLRVSRPTHSGATGVWLLERRRGERCDALAANVRAENDVIERRAHHSVDQDDGSPAIGSVPPPTKNCREGYQRGVHRNLLPIIWDMRAAGAMPAAIVARLHRAWVNGELHDTISVAGDLPSRKQLKVRSLYISLRAMRSARDVRLTRRTSPISQNLFHRREATRLKPRQA